MVIPRRSAGALCSHGQQTRSDAVVVIGRDRLTMRTLFRFVLRWDARRWNGHCLGPFSSMYVHSIVGCFLYPRRRFNLAAMGQIRRNSFGVLRNLVVKWRILLRGHALSESPRGNLFAVAFDAHEAKPSSSATHGSTCRGYITLITLLRTFELQCAFVASRGKGIPCIVANNIVSALNSLQCHPTAGRRGFENHPCTTLHRNAFMQACLQICPHARGESERVVRDTKSRSIIWQD